MCIRAVCLASALLQFIWTHHCIQTVVVESLALECLVGGRSCSLGDACVAREGSCYIPCCLIRDIGHEVEPRVVRCRSTRYNVPSISDQVVDSAPIHVDEIKSRFWDKNGTSNKQKSKCFYVKPLNTTTNRKCCRRYKWFWRSNHKHFRVTR